MNAYELADELEWHWDNDCRSPAVSKSADMLRQQADRIAELEKDLALKTRDRDVFRDFTLAYEKRIAELEKLVHQRFDDGKRLGTIETEDRLLKQSEPVAWFDGEHYVCPEIGYEYTITTEHPKALGWKPLYTTPQTKPLSQDYQNKYIEQYWIKKPLSDEEIKELHKSWTRWIDGGYELQVVHFARAIEAKIRGEK